VLQKTPGAAGAHYGLAFLLLREGEAEEATGHLEAFLANAPEDADASEHVDHARATLAQLRGEAHDSMPEAPPPDELF
jgi:cytochrome c-type biogenesis protein CcmH/NrfG